MSYSRPWGQQWQEEEQPRKARGSRGGKAVQRKKRARQGWEQGEGSVFERSREFPEGRWVSKRGEEEEVERFFNREDSPEEIEVEESPERTEAQFQEDIDRAIGESKRIRELEEELARLRTQLSTARSSTDPAPLSPVEEEAAIRQGPTEGAALSASSGSANSHPSRQTQLSGASEQLNESLQILPEEEVDWSPQDADKFQRDAERFQK